MTGAVAARLGIDIGGTKVAFLAQPANGAEPGNGSRPWELRREWPATGNGVSADVNALAAWCRTARAACGGRVGSVGAAVPATLGSDGRVTAWPNRPDWTGFPLIPFLEQEFPGATIRHADDGNLAALAEARECGRADLAYLGVGTGIGGGLVLGGQVTPSLGDGCELGHLIVAPGGAACTCGRRGCVQAVASGPATLRRAEQRRGRPVPAAELAAGFARGQDWAVDVVTESAAALAVVVVNLTELLKIGLVLIGGGFAAALPGLTTAVTDQAARLGRPGHPPARIEPAALGPDSSLYGALLLAGRTGPDE